MAAEMPQIPSLEVELTRGFTAWLRLLELFPVHFLQHSVLRSRFSQVD